MLLSVCPSFCQSFCNIFVNTLEATSFIPFWLGSHFVHTSGSLLISKFKCQRSRSHLNLNHALVFILVKTLAYIFKWILTKLGPHFVHTSGSLLISKFKCKRSRSHLNFNNLLVFILVKTLAYIFQWILAKLSRHVFHTKSWSLFWRSQLGLSFSHLTVGGYAMLCVAFVIVLSVYYQMCIALQVTVHTWGSNPFL